MGVNACEMSAIDSSSSSSKMLRTAGVAADGGSALAAAAPEEEAAEAAEGACFRGEGTGPGAETAAELVDAP